MLGKLMSSKNSNVGIHPLLTLWKELVHKPIDNFQYKKMPDNLYEVTYKNNKIICSIYYGQVEKYVG